MNDLRRVLSSKYAILFYTTNETLSNVDQRLKKLKLQLAWRNNELTIIPRNKS